jgi:hypothetical protein
MTALTAPLRSSTLRLVVVLALLAVGLVVTGPATANASSSASASAAAAATPCKSDFGPNVCVFDPSMPVSQIQATVDAIATQQVPNQFGPQRYALLFKPGTYGTADEPLNFQVGYYTDVAGLGASPKDVVINGSIYVRNQCDANNSCIALTNFWRSMSNLTINVTNPDFGCYTGEFWAVSQAAPMRRVQVNGLMTLMDYCTAPSFASGGFIADSRFDGNTVINGSQQQFFVRNSTLDGWTNGVWNQVFAGDVGALTSAGPIQPWRQPRRAGRSPTCTSTEVASTRSSSQLPRRTPLVRPGLLGGQPPAGLSHCPISLLRNRPTPSRRSITSSRGAGTCC